MANEMTINATAADCLKVKDGAWLNLEEILELMSKYGKPRLSRLSAGWYCAIDMWVGAKGVEFKIDSECRHMVAADAARECLKRLDDVLISFGV